MTTKTASTQKGTLFNALTSLADEIGTEKTAAAQEKSAAPTPSDPGGYDGASSHPTTGIDNRGQGASEGARSSENATDVKADQPVGVDQTAEATAGSDVQDGQQLNIGTQQSATGEDSSVENDYKGTKDDPGTSHPAKTEDGEKYSSAKVAQAYAIPLANSILADLANGYGSQLKTASNVEPVPQPVAPAPAAEETPTEPAPTEEKSASVDPELLKAASVATEPEPAIAGYELATSMGLEKAAAFEGVRECVSGTIKDAHLDADLFGSYYTAFADNMHKQAMGEDPMGGAEDGEEHGAPPEGAPPEGAPPEGGGEDLGGLGDLLGGGGGGGEPPMGEDPMGGDPMGGGEMGGGPSEEEAIMQLAAALDELGIPLEALAGAAGGEMGGDPMGGGMPPEGMGAPPEMGGAPPEMGGAPPEGMPPGAGGPPGMEVAAAAREELQKVAGVLKRFKQSGKYQFTPAAVNTPQRALRDTMRGYVAELVQAAS